MDVNNLDEVSKKRKEKPFSTHLMIGKIEWEKLFAYGN
jgi:hypothetical protein